MEAAEDKILAFASRILRLKDAQDAIGSDIRKVYSAARAQGLDKTLLGQLVYSVRAGMETGDNQQAHDYKDFGKYINALRTSDLESDTPSRAHARVAEEWEQQTVTEIVCRHCRIDPAELWSMRRGRHGLARQLVMYLMVTGLDMEREQVGRLVGRHHSTVAHACEVIEERRDGAAFDHEVMGLEMELQARLPHRRLVIGCGTTGASPEL